MDHRRAVLGIALLSLAGSASAADFPTRPIRIVVGFTSGGQPDIFSRLISSKLSESLGQTIVVDNRPGAGGTIATKIVADATPDGYTLLSVSGSYTIAPAVRKVSYDPLRDLTAVTQTYSASYVLVAANALGVKSVRDLIALAKQRPGKLNFASAGTGSGTYFAGVQFKDAAGIDVVHVPYKGIPEALNDTMTNRVQFFMVPLASSASLLRDGRITALGVSATKHVASFPDIPTIAESGLPGFFSDSWGGMLAPAKTPRAIIDQLNRAITDALRLPDIGARMRALGAEPAPSTPEAFERKIRKELRDMANVARRAGLKPE